MMGTAEIERRLTKLRVPAAIIDKHIRQLRALRREPTVRRKSRWYGKSLRVEYRTIFPGGGRTKSEFVWLFVRREKRRAPPMTQKRQAWLKARQRGR
jgi:hypothetical protein